MASIITQNPKAFFPASTGGKIDTESFNFMVLAILEDLSTLKTMQEEYLSAIDVLQSRVFSDILSNIDSSTKSIEALITKYTFLNNSNRFTTAEFYNLFDNTSSYTSYLGSLDPVNITKTDDVVQDLDRLVLDGGAIKVIPSTSTEKVFTPFKGVIDTSTLLSNSTIYDISENFQTNFTPGASVVGETFYFLTKTTSPISFIYEGIAVTEQNVNNIYISSISDLPFTLRKIELIDNSGAVETFTVNTDIYFDFRFRFSDTPAKKIRLYLDLKSCVKSNIYIQNGLQSTLQALVRNPLLFKEMVSSNTAFQNSTDYSEALFYVFSLGIDNITASLDETNHNTSYFFGKPTIIRDMQDFALKFDDETTIDNMDPANYTESAIVEPYVLMEHYDLLDNMIDRQLLSVPNWNKSQIVEFIQFDGDVNEAIAGLRFLPDTTLTHILYEDGVVKSHNLNDKTISIAGWDDTKQYVLKYSPTFISSVGTIHLLDEEKDTITDIFEVNDGTISGSQIVFELTAAPDQNEVIVSKLINGSIVTLDTNITIADETFIVFNYDPTDATRTNSKYYVEYTPLSYTNLGGIYSLKNDGSIKLHQNMLPGNYSYSKVYPLLIAYNPFQNLNISSLIVYGTSNRTIQPIVNYNDGSTVTLSQIPSGLISDVGVAINNVGTIPTGADVVAKRVAMADGDTPNTNLSGLLVSDWVLDQTLEDYDAVTVNGVLKHDVNKNTDQYATFFFRRAAVPKFKIYISGTYQNIWVKMFGLSNIPNTTNDWFDMGSLFSGTGAPGRGANDDGCALGQVASGTGEFVCSFGEINSSSATNNIILVRIKLGSGDMITGLEFRGLN